MRVSISPSADQDIEAHFAYLTEHAGLDVALRFLDSTRRCMLDFAEMPTLGELQEFCAAELVGVRKWHVPRFRSYLVFYCAKPECLRIIRILHESRDVRQVLTDSLQEEAALDDEV